MSITKGKTCDLTVIIPHYNDPDALSRLLDSIGCHNSVQIIVVDDGSDRFLNELAACRIKYGHVLFLQTAPGKKGAGAARNTGLSQAAGRWLLFADSDDIFLADWLEVVSPYLASDYDAVYFAPVSEKRDGTPSKRHERYEKLVDNYLSFCYGGEEKLRGSFTAPWSKLIRASLIDKHRIQFDEVFYSADVMFSAKVGYYAEKITADKTPYYCIIEHDDSMSRTKTGDVYCKRLRIYCQRDAFFRMRWTKKQFNAYGGLCFVSSMKDVLKSGYDWRTVAAMWKIYKEYDIPFISVNYGKHADRIRQRFIEIHRQQRK